MVGAIPFAYANEQLVTWDPANQRHEDHVGHKVEWGWPVALYLVTKGIAAGAAMIAPFLAGFGVTVDPDLVGECFAGTWQVGLVRQLAAEQAVHALAHVAHVHLDDDGARVPLAFRKSRPNCSPRLPRSTLQAAK